MQNLSNRNCSFGVDELTRRQVDKSFRVRAYGRTELAQLYNPHLTPGRAWIKLQEWIRYVPEAERALARLGYRKTQRTFTPAQVALIVRWLGEP